LGARSLAAQSGRLGVDRGPLAVNHRYYVSALDRKARTIWIADAHPAGACFSKSSDSDTSAFTATF
jgi:hypothetical protein